MNKYKKIPSLLILVGPPGSGKSTFAQEYISQHAHWLRVCRDDLRAMQFANTRASDSTEVAVSKMANALITNMLQQGKNVIADATHCKLASINDYIKQYKHLANIKFKVFDLPLDELKQRCTKRAAATGKIIGDDVVEKMYKDFITLKANFNFEPINCKPKIFTPLAIDNTKPTCILCDLDGTVALPNGRSMFSPTDEEVLNDTPVTTVIELLKLLASKHNIIFVSGRNETSRTATEQWIQQHISIPYTLYMRATNDMRRDSVVKKEILHTYILPSYAPLAVFDDRLQVIRECWNAEGVFCFNVNQLMEEF
jgi:predicted kinase